ncbi:MAG: hypothetical protein K2G63_01445 [Oscillospiraceae bacterium]|nr:hypothetical protein [Oscillospiraceae bacterium]
MVSQRDKGRSIIDNISNYTIIDLETTSKYTASAEIIEMSAVKVRNSKIIDTYNTLVQPLYPVPSKTTKITGITNEMLFDAPKIEKKIQEYLDFIGDDVILGHNISSYDSTILYDVCEKLGLKPFNNDMIDTLRFVQYCDIDVSDYKLTTLTEYFKIEHNAHRALNDCIANFYVYEKLKEKYTGKFTRKYSATSSNNSGRSLFSCPIREQYADISGKLIVLTGDFQIGKRSDIKAKLEELGASVKSGVSSKTNYVIIGSLGSIDWKFGEYGGKVAKAQELQKKGKPVEILKEEEFFICQKQSV